MFYAIVTLALMGCIYAPQLWVRWVMHAHSSDRLEIPGTGAELANHLLKRYELEGYAVEETVSLGDHFDPGAQCVRLSPSNYSGRSLTAIAIAAHEVGHAIQHQRKERISRLRDRYVPRAKQLQRLGVICLTLVPMIGLLSKAPIIFIGFIALGIGLQICGALAYLIVLPEEWDASFNKALPILIDGNYIESDHVPAVDQILRAAAYTYFAGALADVLNLSRWLMLLLRR